jgi:3-oxoacyl-[acyl-carrier protein] reductase
VQTTFNEKVVFVSGGSRGIGRAIVEGFAAAGATVLYSYATADAAARDLAGAISAKGGKVSALKVDVRDSAACAGALDLVEREHGRLDVLVNNAGIIRDTLIMTMEDADWGDVLATNLTGAFNLIRPASRLMMRRRQGAVVNLSSVAATRPGRGHSNYAASKGGIEALTKALAVELAGKNIRVNCVAPGMIETDMSKDVRQLAGDQILSRILLKRYGTPQDVANAVLFLASDLAAYVTGTVLHVDGGIGA